PVGRGAGTGGIPIQTIVKDLNGEKIDVVQWSGDPKDFIANALSPAQVVEVQLREDDHAAAVIVPDKQLSLAIGKEGQNVRLAAKLTGWRIDIKSEEEKRREVEAQFGALEFPGDTTAPAEPEAAAEESADEAEPAGDAAEAGDSEPVPYP